MTKICDFPYPVLTKICEFHCLSYDLTKNVIPYFMTCPINGGKMAKIDTLFMTKTIEKPQPLGPHIPI